MGTPNTKGKKLVSTWVDTETVNRLDAVAKSLNLTRANLVENLITVSVPEIETIDKLGIFKLAAIMASMQTTLKTWSRQAVESPEEVVESANYV